MRDLQENTTIMGFFTVMGIDLSLKSTRNLRVVSGLKLVYFGIGPLASEICGLEYTDRRLQDNGTLRRLGSRRMFLSRNLVL